MTLKKLICPKCDESVSNVKYYIDEETNEKQYYWDNCSMEADKEEFQK